RSERRREKARRRAPHRSRLRRRRRRARRRSGGCAEVPSLRLHEDTRSARSRVQRPRSRARPRRHRPQLAHEQPRPRIRDVHGPPHLDRPRSCRTQGERARRRRQLVRRRGDSARPRGGRRGGAPPGGRRMAGGRAARGRRPRGARPPSPSCALELMLVVVLDSLFESLDVEREVAARYGARIVRLQDDPALLPAADVVAHVRTRIDAGLIDAMPACRVIARFGTGLDTVDLEAAGRAGIAVVGVRDYCIPELTSHTLGLAFTLTRRIRELDGVEAGWDEGAPSGTLPGARRAAVVGLGSVGTAVASALAAMGFNVLAATSRPDAACTVGATPVSLAEALEAAELVLLHLALTEETAGLLDRRRLGLMRPGAILVNTARIGLLDDEAVAHALDAGRLGGLGLDARLPA